MRRWAMAGGSAPFSPSWLYPSVQLPPFRLRPAPGKGTAPGERAPRRAGPGRTSQRPGRPTPGLSVPPTPPCLARVLGVRAPPSPLSRGGGESFLCLLGLLPLPCSPAAGRGEEAAQEPSGASGPHARPEPAPTHCSGRRPAGPAPWPPLGLHRDPRPLRPRRPGPGAAGTHLRRAHDAAAILATSSSRAAPAAAAAAAALCSARRWEGPRWGRHCGAGLGAGPDDRRGGA